MIRRVALPAAGAAAVLAAVTLGAAGLGSILRPPTPDVVLAAKELGVLDATRNGGALIVLAGRRLEARCSPDGRAALVSFGRADRILVRGTRVRSRWAVAPPLLAAAADLSGVHRLLAAELADRVRSTSHLLDGTVRWHGRRVLLLRIGGDRPRVDLLVDAATLRPVAIRFRARQFRGASTLLPPRLADGPLVDVRRIGC